MRSLAGMIANQKTANEERGTKFTTTGTTTATAKPEEEVSERTRWNDPADRIVSAYVSLAEGNICVMACESYVTQERTSSPSLSLFSIFLFLSCPFLGTCALFSASLCLPSSHKGYGGHRSPVATGGTSGEPQEENIFFLYPPQSFGPRRGRFGFEANAEIADGNLANREKSVSWFCFSVKEIFFYICLSKF